jgi:AraC-like DNA-binding protein
MVPYLPMTAFVDMLLLFYREINHDEISRNEIRNAARAAVNIMDQMISDSFDENTSQLKKPDMRSYYEYERKISAIVESGDINAIKNEYTRITFPPMGKLANTERRQANNVFTIFTTMVSRSAIRGGLDAKTALELSNRYIYESEQCGSIHAVEGLYTPMLYDFTSMVASQKIPQRLSPDIYRCVQFIRENVRRPIAVDDVSLFLKKSRSLVSKKFKREMGKNLNAYIVDCKLEAAKDILLHSEKSISYISTTFYFSSQGYFQRLFKNKYGTTPFKFRQLYKSPDQQSTQ